MKFFNFLLWFTNYYASTCYMWVLTWQSVKWIHHLLFYCCNSCDMVTTTVNIVFKKSVWRKSMLIRHLEIKKCWWILVKNQYSSSKTNLVCISIGKHKTHFFCLLFFFLSSQFLPVFSVLWLNLNCYTICN